MVDREITGKIIYRVGEGELTIKDGTLYIALRKPIWNCYTDEWAKLERTCPQVKESKSVASRKYINPTVPCYTKDYEDPCSCDPKKCPRANEVRVKKTTHEINRDVLENILDNCKNLEEETACKKQAIRCFLDGGGISRCSEAFVQFDLEDLTDQPVNPRPALQPLKDGVHQYKEELLQKYNRFLEDCKDVRNLIESGKYTIAIKVEK